jgi:hypothetical protein
MKAKAGIHSGRVACYDFAPVTNADEKPLWWNNMAEPSQDPTNRELLERIVKLEAENAKLDARLHYLELRDEHHHEFHKTLTDDIYEARSWVVELLAKVFPGWARTQTQIVDIFKWRDKAE